jgi:hypothetical protein
MSLTAKLGDDAYTDIVGVLDAEDRNRYAKALQDRWAGVPLDGLDRELQKAALEVVSSTSASAGVESATPAVTGEDFLSQTPEDIVAEAEQMLLDPNLFRRTLDDIERLGVAGERTLTGTIHMVGVSRLLDKPLSARVRGLSSSGKSYSIEKTALLFPPEGVIRATQLSPQALFYMPPGSLVHKLVVAGERSTRNDSEAAEATRALREMQSAGRLSKLMPVKVSGKFVTVLIEQEGPIAYLETTTVAKVFDEDENRSLSLQTDEQASQTKRIIEHLAARAGGAADQEQLERIVQRHHALQRLLVSHAVLVPFAERLGGLFPSDRIESRRAFSQVMSVIEAVALLHQRQRRKDDQGRLVALPEDYRIARHLLREPMARLLGDMLPEGARRCGERMQAWAGETFTARDVQERETVSGRAVRGWLGALAEAGILDVAEPPRGNLPARFRWGRRPLEEVVRDCPGLPAMGDVFPNLACPRSGNLETPPINPMTPERAFSAGPFRQTEMERAG